MSPFLFSALDIASNLSKQSSAKKYKRFGIRLTKSEASAESRFVILILKDATVSGPFKPSYFTMKCYQNPSVHIIVRL